VGFPWPDDVLSALRSRTRTTKPGSTYSALVSCQSLRRWRLTLPTVFELVSAYGTVGLSLGTPNANYSFSGELKPLSKLIICAVMIRGRHRGLPVAIDRAVLLPSEFKKQEPQPLDDEPYVDVGDESVLGDGQRTSQTGHGNGVDTRRRSSSVPGAHRKATV
ncbi:TrkH-domain-containing protein, partial [Exidia glandulosa HHB12029]